MVTITKISNLCNNAKLTAMQKIVFEEEQILKSELSKAYYQGKIDFINEIIRIRDEEQ